MMRLIMHPFRWGFDDFPDRDPLLEAQLLFARVNGSPLLVNLDNMKEAVPKADWFELEINPFAGLLATWFSSEQVANLEK